MATGRQRSFRNRDSTGGRYPSSARNVFVCDTYHCEMSVHKLHVFEYMNIILYITIYIKYMYLININYYSSVCDYCNLGVGAPI